MIDLFSKIKMGGNMNIYKRNNGVNVLNCNNSLNLLF